MVRSVEKTCGMSEKEENDLFYVCSLIEHVGISDMHCMSDEYLVDELVEERKSKGT